MLFCISKTSALEEQPCEEAFLQLLTPVDIRMASSPEEIPYYQTHGTEEWWEKGKNHRLIEGKIARDLQPRQIWLIEIKSLEDLLSLSAKYGDLVFTANVQWQVYAEETFPFIEIYDSYRE